MRYGIRSIYGSETILISLFIFLFAADSAAAGLCRAGGLRADTTAYAAAGDVIEAYFRLISGPSGLRDWERFKDLSLPTAQFNAVGVDTQGQSVFFSQTRDEYIAHVAEYLEHHGFYQREISRRQVRYGRMAHVLSAYESRNEEEGAPIDRGLISFQLVEEEGRWWLVNVLWHSETPAYPLPEVYLERR